MEKKLLTIIMLLSVSNIFALDLQPSVGLNWRWPEMSWDYTNQDGNSSSLYYPQFNSSNVLFPVSVVGLGGFFDYTLIRAGFNYNFNIAKQWYTVDGETEELDYTYHFIDLYVIPKYEFKLGTGSLWIGPIVEYDVTVLYQDEDGNDIEDAALNDFYAGLVVGYKLDLEEKTYVTFDLGAEYNLTPEISSGDWIDETSDWSGYKLIIDLGVGYYL